MKKLISLIASVAMVATTGFSTALADDDGLLLLDPKSGATSYWYTTATYPTTTDNKGVPMWCARIQAESAGDKFGNDTSAFQVVSRAGYSNGSGVAINGIVTEDTTYTIKVVLPVTGYYNIAHGVHATSALSPISISYNGNAYEGIRVYANTSVNTTSEGANYTRLNRNASPDSPSFGSGNDVVQIHQRKTPILLNEGENILVFKTTKRQNYTSNGQPDNRVFAAIDFIDISFARAEYGNAIELEDVIDTNVISEETASSKSVTRFNDSTGVLDSKSCTINAAESGLYTLKIGAATSANHPWLSPLVLDVNNQEFNFDVDHMTQYAFIQKQNNTFSPALYTFENIYLKQGENTLTFTATPRTEGGLYAALDFVDFYKTADVETYTVEDKGLITKDEEAVGYYYTIGLSAIENASDGVTLNTHTISSLPEVDCPTLLQYLILGGSYTETTIPAITKVANGSVEYYAE